MRIKSSMTDNYDWAQPRDNINSQTEMVDKVNDTTIVFYEVVTAGGLIFNGLTDISIN